MANTELINKVKQLATAVGEDIKSIKSTSSIVPTINLSVEPNGDVYADVVYPEGVTPGTPSPTPTPSPPPNAIANGTTKIYDVAWGIAQPGAPGAGRGYLEYSPISGFGKLHLDIRMTNNSGNGNVIATLPANSPVPTRLLEVAVDANNASVYVEPNSRNIKGWGVVGNNRRYIFDITGFWRETT